MFTMESVVFNLVVLNVLAHNFSANVLY